MVLWFLAGTAKHTLQRTLIKNDNTQWNGIAASYSSHHEIHNIMELNTALNCNMVSTRFIGSQERLSMNGSKPVVK